MCFPEQLLPLERTTKRAGQHGAAGPSYSKDDAVVFKLSAPGGSQSALTGYTTHEAKVVKFRTEFISLGGESRSCQAISGALCHILPQDELPVEQRYLRLQPRL